MNKPTKKRVERKAQESSFILPESGRRTNAARPKAQANGRLESLDALRGFDMFFICGGSALLVAIANLFPDSHVWQAIADNMEHVPWDGLRHHDTIFPLFLFIAGVSFPFSLERQREKGTSTPRIFLRIVRRGLTLVFLGLLYNGLLDFHWDTLRFCSVLSRIGLAWMFGAIIYTAVKDVRLVVAIVAVLLVGYWICNILLIAPGAPVGADPLSKEWNIGCYIDRTILGAHCYRPEYDPEGLFSTLPAIGTALLGMLTGRFVRRDDADISPRRKALCMFLAGIGFALLGWAWGVVYPINKALWSSSFVCAVAGYSLIMFALFYFIIDVLKWRGWDFFFVVIGMNSITIYLAQRFALFEGISHKLFDGTVRLFAEPYGSVVEIVGYIAVWWLFLLFLYKKKVFLKV